MSQLPQQHFLRSAHVVCCRPVIQRHPARSTVDDYIYFTITNTATMGVFLDYNSSWEISP